MISDKAKKETDESLKKSWFHYNLKYSLRGNCKKKQKQNSDGSRIYLFTFQQRSKNEKNH